METVQKKTHEPRVDPLKCTPIDNYVEVMIAAEKDNRSAAVITDQDALKLAFLRWRGAYNTKTFIPSDCLRDAKAERERR